MRSDAFRARLCLAIGKTGTKRIATSGWRRTISRATCILAPARLVLRMVSSAPIVPTREMDREGVHYQPHHTMNLKMETACSSQQINQPLSAARARSVDDILSAVHGGPNLLSMALATAIAVPRPQIPGK